MSRKLLPNPAGTANLQRGSVKGEDKVTKKRAVTDREVKRISLRLIRDKEYQRVLREKLQNCTLHPSVQVMLWQYAFGKVKEEIEVTPIVPVRITHEYSDDK